MPAENNLKFERNYKNAKESANKKIAWISFDVARQIIYDYYQTIGNYRPGSDLNHFLKNGYPKENIKNKEEALRYLEDGIEAYSYGDVNLRGALINKLKEIYPEIN